MGYIDGPIRKYLDDSAAKLPAPGGGSISALAGALAASMGSMSARFTVGKKKYADVEPQIQAALDEFERCRERLAELTDEDTELYEQVMAAWRMPKDTPEQKKARAEAIEQKSKDAIAVPREIMQLCTLVCKKAAEIVGIANKNLITDIGVAAILAEAACRAARLNIDINLGGIEDTAYKEQVAAETAHCCAEALTARTDVDRTVGEALRG